MNWFIRRFLWRLLSRPIVRAVAWNADEIKQFEVFCRSSCGLKLLEFLRQHVASITFNAVYRDRVSANAEARGAQNTLALIHRLKSFPPEAESYIEDEDVEPIPSQRGAFDGRRFNLSGGRSAISSY